MDPAIARRSATGMLFLFGALPDTKAMIMGRARKATNGRIDRLDQKDRLIWISVPGVADNGLRGKEGDEQCS